MRLPWLLWVYRLILLRCIIHGAEANTSDQRRADYTMRYFPTSARIYPEKNEGMHFWLARGKDIAGNVYQNVP